MNLPVLGVVLLVTTVVGACAFSPLHGGPWSGALQLRNTGLVSRASSKHASLAALKMTANSPIDLYANTGQYDDKNELDKTTLEGHVTKTGEKISQYHTAVRGELIDCATAESDITEAAWQDEYVKAFGVLPPMEKLYDDETQAQAGWYDGEIDRDAELAKAHKQGWISGTADVEAEEAVLKLARAKEKAGTADPDEDNSVQARFLRDRARKHSSAAVAAAAAAVSAPAAAPSAGGKKIDYGSGYKPSKK